MNATPEWMSNMNQDVDDLEQEYVPPEPEAQDLEPEAEQPEEQGQEQQTVPLATLIEERKRLQQQLEEERAGRARFERLEDEIRRMRETRQQPAPEAKPAPPPVDYLEDPKGYVDSTKEELIERLKKLEGTTEQVNQATQQANWERQVRSALGAAESTYVGQQPDYYDALNYVRQVKAREMAVTYPQARPEQIQQALSQGEIAWGAQLLQQGLNPSAQAYKMAQALGYQAKTEQNPKQQQAANSGKAGESGVDRRRLQGMGGGQSGAAPADSELERLMDGSADEFDQAMGELFGKRR